MEYVIENSRLRVCMSTYGAELMSIQTKENPVEFLWQGDPAHWARRALVMFPVVGSFPDDTYYVDGKPFSMPVNGFAKLTDFNVSEKEKDRIVFTMNSNENTRSRYPYDFHFSAEYVLTDSRLDVKFKTLNRSGFDMPFAVGGHPGFRWPLFQNESPEDYRLSFEQKEEAETFNASGETVSLLNNENVLSLSHDMFADGAIYVSGLRSKWVEMGNPESSLSIRIYREEFPYLILWSQKAEQASYLCIEPCLGIGQTETELRDRKGIVVLKDGEEHHCTYGIEIGSCSNV